MAISLYKKDKKGNVLVWTISVTELHLKSVIKVFYGRLGGNLQNEQTVITKGKSNRTYKEQTELEVNSKISKQKDKGYKSLEDLGYLLEPHEEGDEVHTSKTLDSKKFGSLEHFLKFNLPEDSTDASGNLKPMKCTALQDTKTNGILEKVKNKIVFGCTVQPKLDGVRCFIFFDKIKEKWVATSSSGKDYNVAASHILYEITHRNLAKNLIFDGELYIHGEPLQYISGLARKQTREIEHEALKFHIFDLALKETWVNRKIRLDSLKALLAPFLESIVFVESTLVTNFQQIENRRLELINLGYEGIIIRNHEGVYEYGKRSSDIFKWKDFQDAEFEITGFELGKRGTEDMVFQVKTEDGNFFKAKPLGTREQKDEYAVNFHKYLGKMATVQFLTYSEGGIPQGNPRVKAIRDYEQ